MKIEINLKEKIQLIKSIRQNFIDTDKIPDIVKKIRNIDKIDKQTDNI